MYVILFSHLFYINIINILTCHIDANIRLLKA